MVWGGGDKRCCKPGDSPGERETWLLRCPRRDWGKGRSVQQDLLSGVRPALVKIIVALSLCTKILRSGLKLVIYCSFPVLPSATSV